MLLLGADLIEGTQIDDWLLATAAILVAVTTVAALSHKPPIRQVGHFIGWVFRRLVGEPIATWWSGVYREQALPLVRAEVEAAVAPVRSEQQAVARDLRAHMEAEAAERVELVNLVTEHVEEDRAAFAEIAEWRSGVDQALARIEAAERD
jgi:hypothetical protein